jgi:hypothetical protein
MFNYSTLVVNLSLQDGCACPNAADSNEARARIEYIKDFMVSLPFCFATSHSPTNVTCTSFISVISVMTMACVPWRSNTIPVARTYLPT